MFAHGRMARWLSPRRLIRLALAGFALGGLLILAEAAIRARLDPAEARVPTTLYSRPAAWANDGSDVNPVPIATLVPGLEEWRIPVRLAGLPDHLIQTVLAVEDQRFLDHRGLDVRRIAGAAVANARAGEVVQGGSTITQQLAKNLFLSSRRTPLRKLREATMSVVLEARYEKTRILEAYLNEIYLGQDGARAIHGVGAAARYYYGKDAGDLTLAESALLAGMIRAPNRYTPVRHPGRARERRDLVLRLMVQQGRVDQRAARRAANQRIRARPARRAVVSVPYFRDFVLARLRRDVGGHLPNRGVAVYTTLDATLQRAAVRAVSEGLASLAAPGAEAALVALDPRTGDVLAMVGGRDYGASQFNRAAAARRQPGSAFKPVVALAALGRDGSNAPAFTLASVIEDEPLSVATPVGRWEPRNYDESFRGPVTLRQAIEQSLNVPIARVGLAMGPRRVADAGKRLGITSALRPVPSLALGTSEVTPLELTRAFGVFATGGELAETRTVLGVRAGSDDMRPMPAPSVRRVADPAETYLVTSALEGAVERGTGRALSSLRHTGGLAGKSGTSSDWRDGWFVAYTPSLAAGVWVGYDDGRSLGLTGSRSALPIVARFLREALSQTGYEAFPVPDGVEFAHVGGDRGWWGGGCDGEPEVFLEGTAPAERCDEWIPRRWIARLDDRPDRLLKAFSDLLERQADELAEVLGHRTDKALRQLAERLSDRALRELRR